jgi:hypothetical protein
MRVSALPVTLASIACIARGAGAQSVPPHPPVIDMHVHSTLTTPKALPRLDSLNVRYFFLAALAPDLQVWSAVDSGRYLPGLVFPCDHGHAPISGRACFAPSADFPDTAWLRGEIEAGRIRALGELVPQYAGMSPDDPRMEPYWALAEKYDLPVAIHLGMSEPGIAYESGHVPWKSRSYRMRFADPLLLEDVLVRHQRLRISVMHAGYPFLERMIALLTMYPNVYVDVAALQTEGLVPRAAYYHYLRGLIDAGFARRIMFGSDFLAQLPQGIAAIEQADFLTPEQKADILCNNAARFLRRPMSVCAP